MAGNNMPNDIVNDIAKLSSRVDGLEAKATDIQSINRIQKVYARVGVSLRLTTYKSYAIFPGADTYPSSNLTPGGNSVLRRD
jgi:hypothetical protein